MKSILNAKMKNLSKQGLGLERKQAVIITVQQEGSYGIWTGAGEETGCNHNCSTGGEVIVYGLGLERKQAIKLMQDSDGRKYLQYTGDISKTNSGGLSHRKVTPKMTRGYESSNKGRCIVQLYIKYIQARPVTAKTDAFYLRPKATITGSCWYVDAPVGVHTLQETVKKLCEEAGFSGHFTNHSLRATAATRLYSARVDEQLIAEKTGHRSNAVRLYKRTSDEQQQKMSEILRGEQKENGVKKQKTSENATGATETVTGGKEITCNIKDGVLNINVKF
ncbi:uncharacterized protein LOC110458797 [Mizuhopecten yessoensis]|uniref:uncharacterized protein LOC110458797 n=1 Tax=Mizuhopecten yessoensis TaxID=6573 RepID=UPI000B45E45A|nr:uncharacterized protein LOC110458797 [Mizuhopecten yessoensis]